MSLPTTMAEVEAHNARVKAGRNRAKNALGCDMARFDGKNDPGQPESRLQAQIAAELRLRRWYFVQSRTDKRTTNQVGTPDFIIAKPDGVTLWIECKRPSGKLSQAQVVTRHVLLALGHKHAIVHSLKEFEEAIL